MINEQTISELREKLNKISDYKSEEVIKRSEWGSLNFEDYESQFKELMDLTNSLLSLPIEHLNQNLAEVLLQKLDVVTGKLDQMSKFTIETTDPSGTRTQIGNQFKTAVEDIHNRVAIWLPYLTYQRGDIDENITSLRKIISEANDELEDAKTEIVSKKDEIDKLVLAVKKASATAGVAVFTDDYESQVIKLIENAQPWLYATLGFVIILIIGSMFFVLNSLFNWFIPTTDYALGYSISSKITFFVFFFTAAFWTGKIYKSKIHQSAVYEQKALAMKTFQAFYEAGNSVQIKDAVLLETTKSIFASINTGLISKNSSEESNTTQIVEIIKSVVEKED